MSVTAHPTPAGTEEYQPVFVGATLEALGEILTRYPTRQAALLPALWLVQGARGWISDRNMAEVAEVLGLTPAYVKGVVTFYTMYHQHPVGRHFVQVCTTSPCNVCGAEDVVRALLERQRARCHEPGRQLDGDRGRVPRGVRLRHADPRERRLHRERDAGQGSGSGEEIQVRDERGRGNAEVGTGCSAFRVPRSDFGAL